MTTNGDIAEGFRALDPDGPPALSELDERRQIFWVLRAGKERFGIDSMTPTEISTVLRDAFGVLVSRQRIEATLGSEKGTVAKRKKDKKRAYQLMASGSDELDVAGKVVLFIEPSRAFTGVRAAHLLLAEFRGDVRVCDPYADTRTLDMLAECEKADSIRLLTHNVKKPTGFKQAVTAFEKEHGVPIEIRLAPPGILHDRYAIHDDGMLLFGTSLNSLGMKQAFVVAVGDDIRATVLGAFEATWQNSAAL
jgi:hypothetical protein